MAKYYFTYGLENHPFSGGWTEVEAESLNMAIEAFTSYHPLRDGFIPCCTVYAEPEFMKTMMAGPAGNFGKRCVERISLFREVVPND